MLEVFLILLLAVSLLTGLTTEAIKSLMDERGKTYHPNTLAGIVSVVLSIAIGTGYQIVVYGALSQYFAIYLIALVFLSWLCSMVGYDKVIQTLSQLKKAE